MKRICEIYDISKDYELPTGTVLIIVSDIEKDKINSILFSITTLIISKKPGNTGISRDIRTEFTTDLLLSD